MTAKASEASRLALVALLGGCWQSSPPPVVTAPLAASRPPTVTTEVATGRLLTPGLPAVSRDGEVVMFAEDKGDGPRGNPNLAFVTVARTDAPIERYVAIDPNKFEDLDEPARQALIVAANQFLAKRHAERALEPMVVWPAPAFTDAGAPHELSHGTLVVHWDDRHLTIMDAGKQVVDRPTPPAWLVHDHPMYEDAPELCSNPAFLGGVAVDRARRLALVTISYEGTDTCPEPTSQHHVVGW